TDFKVVSGFTGLSFGQADAADLGMAVRCARDALAVDLLGGFAGNLGYSDQTFHGSDVRQLRRAEDDVADGVNAGLRSLHPGIGFDEFTLGLDLGAFEPDTLRAGFAADGDQDLFGLNLLLLAVDGDGHCDAGFRL